MKLNQKIGLLGLVLFSQIVFSNQAAIKPQPNIKETQPHLFNQTPQDKVDKFALDPQKVEKIDFSSGRILQNHEVGPLSALGASLELKWRLELRGRATDPVIGENQKIYFGTSEKDYNGRLWVVTSHQDAKQVISLTYPTLKPVYYPLAVNQQGLLYAVTNDLEKDEPFVYFLSADMKQGGYLIFRVTNLGAYNYGADLMGPPSVSKNQADGFFIKTRAEKAVDNEGASSFIQCYGAFARVIPRFVKISPNGDVDKTFKVFFDQFGFIFPNTHCKDNENPWNVTAMLHQLPSLKDINFVENTRLFSVTIPYWSFENEKLFIRYSTALYSLDDLNFMIYGHTIKTPFFTPYWVDLGKPGTLRSSMPDWYEEIMKKIKHFSSDAIYSTSITHPTTQITYVGDHHSIFRAVKPNGELYFNRLLGGDLSKAQPTIGPDNRIYVPSTNGYIYVLKPDGRIDRELKLSVDGAVHGFEKKVIVGSSDSYVYATTSDGYLAVFDPNAEEGHELLAYINRNIVTAPAVGKDGLVYVGTANGDLLAFLLKLPRKAE